MYVRIDDILIDVNEIQTAQLITDRDSSKPLLKMNFKRGRSVYISDSPAFVFDTIVEALDSVGVLFEPEPEAEPIELSPETEELLRGLHDEGYAWIAEDPDGKCWGFRSKPELNGTYWEDGSSDVCRIRDPAIIGVFDCSDEPLNILEALLGT